MRLLCVWLPHFPFRCEVCRKPALAAGNTAVIHEAGSQKAVLDFSPDLEDLRPGMPLQQALALHGDIRLVHDDAPYYRSVFNELLDSLETKSPLVEGAEMGCAYIGLDGMELLYPDDEAFVSAVKEAVPEAFASRMGIAEGKFLACLAARYSPPGGWRALAGDLTAFLKDLPCDVLPVSEKARSKLRDFGIHTLGQIAALPPGPLQAQFGPEGRRLRELAGGRDNTPLRPRSMEETIEESAALPSVTVSIDALVFAIESLLARVFARDSLKGRGIRALTLWTRTWRAEHWERAIQFKDAAMDLKSAMPRIRKALEDYPQPGPVEQVGLKLARLGYGNSRQRSLFSRVRAQDHLRDDIRQLEQRLGGHQIFRVKEVEPWSRIPERRRALKPFI